MQLTTNLLRLMLPSVVLFGLSGLLMGILNSYQKFLVPALAPAMYSLGMIFGILFLAPSMGIYGLAWGVLIGAALHLLVQVPSLLRLHGKYTPRLGLEMAEVREVGRLLLPRLLGVAFVQLNFWINIRLASYMLPGSVNGLLYAFSLLLTPIAIIAQAIAIAALPTFSRQVAQGRLDEMRNSLAASLRGVILLALPAGIGLILLRQPVVELVFQRGAFDNASTELVAWALLWYSVGLVGHCMVEVLTRAYFAMHDTWTPVLIGVGAIESERPVQPGIRAAVRPSGLDAGWRSGAGELAGNAAGDGRAGSDHAPQAARAARQVHPAGPGTGGSRLLADGGSPDRLAERERRPAHLVGGWSWRTAGDQRLCADLPGTAGGRGARWTAGRLA